jgi:nicotinamidase-related amidase
VTTQVASKFGPTVPEIQSMLPETIPTFDKTAFSMVTTDVIGFIRAQAAKRIVIAGIETHVCVAQSALGENVPKAPEFR